MSQTLTTRPHSSPALNPRWLRANLARHIWQDHEVPGEIVDLDIYQAWEARKRTTMLYALALRGADNHIHRQTYVGYQPKERHLVEEYRAMLNQADTQPPLGRAVTLVQEANLILVAFPNDRKMRLLTESELHVWVEHHLSQILPKPLEERSWQVRGTKLEVLRYIPNKRFTIRCRVTIGNNAGEGKNFSFIVKQFSDSTKARRVHRSLESLHKAMINKRAGSQSSRNRRVVSNRQVRLPHEIAFDQTKALVFMEDLPGKELKEVLGQVKIHRVMPAVGELLARFHLIKKSVSKCVSIKSEVKEVRDTLDIIRESQPPLRSSPEGLFKQLKAVKWVDDVPRVLLHGSFRLNHLLFHHDELALLDLDSLRMGHPAYDIANFLSSLYYWEYQGQLRTPVRKKISRFFLEGYAQTTPYVIPSTAVLWYLASLLINKQAHKFVTHLHDDQKGKVGRVLRLAEGILQKATQLPDDLSLADLWRALP